MHSRSSSVSLLGSFLNESINRHKDQWVETTTIWNVNQWLICDLKATGHFERITCIFFGYKCLFVPIFNVAISNRESKQLICIKLHGFYTDFHHLLKVFFFVIALHSNSIKKILIETHKQDTWMHLNQICDVFSFLKPWTGIRRNSPTYSKA